MDQVLRGCEDWSAAYLDDVVIYSMTLRPLARSKSLNVVKCEWVKSETNYLGYHLGNGELKLQVDKVDAVRHGPRQRTKKEVRSSFGLVEWYRHFIPNFSTTVVPLTDLLCKNVKNPIFCTEECEGAFNTLKEWMCSHTVLKSPPRSLSSR